MKKLPSLKMRKGSYQGMCRGNEVYGADYYAPEDVKAYKKAAKALAKENKKLRELLRKSESLG